MTDPEDYQDVHSVLRTPAHIGIQSALLKLEFDTNREEFDGGIVIHQDGADLAIGAGSLDDGVDGPRLKAYHRLSVEQARSLAYRLQEAADAAEAAEEHDQPTPSADAADGSGSLLKRWLR